MRGEEAGLSVRKIMREEEWGGHVGEYMATLPYLLNFSEKSKTILKKIKPTNKKYKTENKEPCMKT